MACGNFFASLCELHFTAECHPACRGGHNTKEQQELESAQRGMRLGEPHRGHYKPGCSCNFTDVEGESLSEPLFYVMRVF